MLPTVQGDIPLYREGDQEGVLTIGTAAWFAWLETASTFSFVSDVGTFTARKERASTQRGGWYWKAYRKQHGKLSSRYLGKSETVTLARLQAVAQDLAAGPVRASPVRAGEAALPPAPLQTERDPLHSLLATKLHVPRLRAQFIRRSRLLERLQQGMECALTLVSAPAGFGKTTLVAQWLAESGIPVAWLSLEPEDNDPVRFLSYLIAALQRLDPHIGTAVLPLLQAPRPAPLERVMALVINELMAGAARDFALVLDDYHVITAEAIHRALIFLLGHLPSHMHLIIATRTDPPLLLAGLRARVQLTEVRAADLRFATDEVSAFLREVMELDLEAWAIAALERRTEGWVVGLQLAALSLQSGADVSTFLAAFTGSHRFVLDYLSEGLGTGSYGSYGMGWNNGTLAGIPAIWHDGAEPNVSTRLLIEPQTHCGAILLVNANNFIPVDGANSALTSLEAGVTRLLAGQAPQASMSLTTLYLIIDGVLVELSALAIFPLLRLRRWSRRFEQRQRRRPQFIRLGLRLIWDVALPMALLLLLLFFVNNFNGATFYDVWLTYPDLDSWLLVICALLLLTAVSRAVLAIRVLRRIGAETSAVTPSPSPSLT